MKKAVFLLMIAAVLGSCVDQKNKAPEQPASHDESVENTTVRDGVFIHISESYDDPHRVLMPLKMAVMMAADRDVMVYMDIDAVELAVRDAKDLQYAEFDSFQSYVKQLTDLGVNVVACPTCLQIAGFNPEDLMNGIKPAEKDQFFNFTNGRILTLDY